MAADRLKLNAALAELLKYSLVRRDTTTQTLTIHRLVQAVIKDEMNEQTQRQWTERAVRAVNQVFPFDEASPGRAVNAIFPTPLCVKNSLNSWISRWMKPQHC